MDLDQLNEIALRMVAPGKGILAADESTRHDQEAL
jgi:fructose-bisphosphate aldolase class I